MTTPAPPGYHAPDEFAAEVARLADRSPTARHHVIGTSVRGRDLVAVTIGPDATGGAAAGAPAVPVRPQLLVLAGIHGVEVISTELALRLLDDATADEPAPAVAAVLARADLTIVPSLNVDGRTASLESLGGRKPLNKAPRRNANGVDLNATGRGRRASRTTGCRCRARRRGGRRGRVARTRSPSRRRRPSPTWASSCGPSPC